MIKLAHILVGTEDEAKKVKERLGKGEDFAKLAKELSTDTGSKDNGGEYEVPYVGSGFDQTFMTAAMAQGEGQISAPIGTQFGFHVIKTIKKTEYPVKKFDTVKEEIKTALLTENQQSKYLETMSKWREEAKIKYYDDNL
jgi:foldase protein PrsA